MDSFTCRLREKVEPIWSSAHRHPFLQELGEGTLAEDRFAYYLCQDYVYLKDYARLFALGAAKADDLETMAAFAAVLHATLHSEMAIHREYTLGFGITLEELEGTQASSVTTAYVSYLLKVALSGTLAELVAVLLPCMWSYHEIGCLLSDRPGAAETSLYKDWITSYSSAEFGEHTIWLRSLLDRLAEGLPERELRRLEEHFIIASRWEYSFWEMAYQKAMWIG